MPRALRYRPKFEPLRTLLRELAGTLTTEAALSLVVEELARQVELTEAVISDE